MKIYIGFDAKEQSAYRVCEYSLRSTCNEKLDIEPLDFTRAIYRRPYEKRGDQRYDGIDGTPFSTSFSFARFLVPMLQDHKGWAMFVDCDFLFTDSVVNLWGLADITKAVQVVKHDYHPPAGYKMDGQQQTSYPRKNWSSLVLWNCGHPANRFLTINDVNSKPGWWLHGFSWLQDEHIGELPMEWNYLVGHYPEKPKALHYTTGGPWFPEHEKCDFAADWNAAKTAMEQGLKI